MKKLIRLIPLVAMLAMATPSFCQDTKVVGSSLTQWTNINGDMFLFIIVTNAPKTNYIAKISSILSAMGVPFSANVFQTNALMTTDAAAALKTIPGGGSNTVALGTSPITVGQADPALSANIPRLANTNRFDSLLITNGFMEVIWTFPGPTNSYDLGKYRQEISTLTPIAITNFLNASSGGYENSSLLTVKNSGSTNITVYVTAASVTTDDGARSYVITNGLERKFSFNHDDYGFHLVARTFF